jgi:MFS superfamily sulfate permease-like transporter
MYVQIFTCIFWYIFSGFLVEFISYPVINSFTTAAAITIAFGQIKVCLPLAILKKNIKVESCSQLERNAIEN